VSSSVACVYCSTARLGTRRLGETYLNGAEVDEEVGGAVLGGDEAVSLLVVEPLDSAVLAFGRGVHFDVMWWVGGGFVVLVLVMSE
jgi:hypothetical protein